LGTVNLQNCEGVLEDPNKKNCFMVVTQIRTYKIIAPSRHEMAEWMVSVKKVIEELNASNRPRSIDGNMLMKMEDKDKLKLFADASQPDPRKEDRLSSGGSLPEANPLANEFFVTEDRTPAHEVEAVILDFALTAVEKSSLRPKLDDTGNDLLLEAVIVRQIVDEVKQNRLEGTFTKSNSPLFSYFFFFFASRHFLTQTLFSLNFSDVHGEKTEFVDATKVKKIVNGMVDEYIQKVLGDSALLERSDPPFSPLSKPSFFFHFFFFFFLLFNSLKSTPKLYISQAWEEQGSRKTMEDRHFTFPYINQLLGNKTSPNSFAMFGIFDGHGGIRAASYLGVHLHANLAQAFFSEQPAEASEDPFIAAITQTFLKTNDNFFDYLTRKALVDASGSTAVTAIIKDRELYVCWVGDSEAALYTKDGENMVLVKPHKSGSEVSQSSPLFFPLFESHIFSPAD